MDKYRCFCLTSDGRVITGAFFQAPSLSIAMDEASKRWRDVAAFSLIEVWLGAKKLYPAYELNSASEPGEDCRVRTIVQTVPERS